MSHGVDGLISLDGGAATTVSNAVAGTAVTLVGAGGDSVVATLAGGLRSGVATTSSVDVAAGATLADVVSALNDPSTGVSATAVQVGTAAYRLQLTSTTTGSASDVTVSSGAFPAGQSTLGDMQELSAGTDTVLHVGTGPGAFDVTSSTTSVTGLMPGVTINAVKADPSTPVTVNVSADGAGMADKMASLVDAGQLGALEPQLEEHLRPHVQDRRSRCSATRWPATSPSGSPTPSSGPRPARPRWTASR